MVAFCVSCLFVHVHNHAHAAAIRIVQAKTETSGMERCFIHDGCHELYYRLCKHHTALLAFLLGPNEGNFLYFMETCISEPATDVYHVDRLFVYRIDANDTILDAKCDGTGPACRPR